MRSNDLFWMNDISVLFKQNKLTEFFPTDNMTLDEKLNSIVRLSIYISIFLFVYNKNFNNIYFFLIALLITYFIHKSSNKKDKINEHLYEKDIDLLLKPKKIVKPTHDNPFGNIMLNEYKENPNRDTKINVNNQKDLDDINSKFNNNLYKDVNDIFNHNNSQRQFIVNPIRTIPNKQMEFAQWCYGRPKTCKEGNGAQCVANNPPSWIGR